MQVLDKKKDEYIQSLEKEMGNLDLKIRETADNFTRLAKGKKEEVKKRHEMQLEADKIEFKLNGDLKAAEEKMKQTTEECMNGEMKEIIP